MNWSNGLSWLSALKSWRIERIERGRDQAEMGTAFGLEASLAGSPGHGAPTWQTPPPAAAETWERRVVRRSGL